MSQETAMQEGYREIKYGGLLHRKIKCPRNYVLKPGGQPFVMEPIQALKNINKIDAKRIGLHLFKRKLDRYGNPVQNFKDYFQPVISAAEARLRIYNANHPDCIKCKRCVTA